MQEKGFLIFGIFLLYFSEFSCPFRVRTEFGTKIFFSLSCQSHPIFFFCNYLGRVGYEQNSGLKFFFHFLGLSHPVLAKYNAGKRFFNFWNFFAIFFRNFLFRVEYERNLGLKFFSFSWLISSPFWQKIMPEIGFFIF